MEIYNALIQTLFGEKVEEIGDCQGLGVIDSNSYLDEWHRSHAPVIEEVFEQLHASNS